MDVMLDALRRRMKVMGEQKPVNDMEYPGSPYMNPSKEFSQGGQVSLKKPKPKVG